MRILRLGYVVPRLLALVVVYLVAEFGSGMLLHSTIEAGGTAAVGAKVELEGAKVSLLETQVRIDQLAIANPSKPMNNLAELARVEADFDTAALLRGKLVVNYGVASGLAFDTDRTTSGALPDLPVADKGEPSWITRQAEAAATQWFETLETRLEEDLHSQLRSVVLARQLAAKWDSRYEHFERQVRQFKAETKRLEQEWKIARQNPLRHGEFLARIPQETTSLRRTLRDIQAQLATLPEELHTDKLALEQAKEHDRKRIAQLAQLEGIDSQALADYLLGEQVTATLADTIGWLKFARKLVPPSASRVDTKAVAGRGTNVTFIGARPLPDVWVKLLRLEGSARFGGQPLEIVGTLHDWSTEARITNKPTLLELRTRGGLPVALQASFDRHGATPRDEFVVRADGLAIPGGSLGKRGKMEFVLAGSTADLLANFRLDGESLSGKVVLNQQGLGVTPEISLERFGEPLEQSLTKRLASLQEGQTEITISGTIENPKVAVDSTVAVALAEAMTGSAAEVAAFATEQLLARGQQEVDTHLAGLEDRLQKFTTEMESELAGPGELVAQLLGQRGEGPPHVGGLLPPGSLFK